MFCCGGPSYKIVDEPTTPYEGQKPGTSGLRKKTQVFTQGNYLANFVQSVFDALPADEVKGATFLVGGDGRYFVKEAVHIIAEIAAGNGAAAIWTGVDGLISTPAASCIIREREEGKCNGGFILTASHNPGGIDNDFGIKYNTANGAPAQESLTNQIFENTKTISRIRRVRLPALDLSQAGNSKTFPEVNNGFTMSVIDSTEDYVKLLETIFDFRKLRALVAHPDFRLCFDGLNGVSGPYAKAILQEKLGVPEDCLVHVTPLEDFGGLHPDPNLTYAEDLVAVMRPFDKEAAELSSGVPAIGFACDGDADRNMVIGGGCFVTPSDSVAIIADYVLREKAIPYFNDLPETRLGVARSMPTSMALDKVAAAQGVQCNVVPTGWKFFGNLMDAGVLAVCGEESFGTGSDHIREKDGLWAVLCWLSILAHAAEKIGALARHSIPLTTVKSIVENHWKTYGRNFYSRYDYEEVDSEAAALVVDGLKAYVAAFDAEGEQGLRAALTEKAGLTAEDVAEIVRAESFTYEDPVDGSVSKDQGYQIFFADGSRFVVRLSGTGSSGATIRLYLERYLAAEGASEAQLFADVKEGLGRVPALAVQACQIERLTGRENPTVIT